MIRSSLYMVPEDQLFHLKMWRKIYSFIFYFIFQSKSFLKETFSCFWNFQIRFLLSLTPETQSVLLNGDKVDIFTFHAVGMAVARSYDLKINFMRSCSSESAARFFFFILEFIFTLIFEIKLHEKIPWPQKISFLRLTFIIKQNFYFN